MRPTGIVLAAILGLVAASSVQAGAPAAYQKCATCHLANGTGVPGAFPPLAGRIAPIASTPEGRRYLVSVPTYGLSGELTVGGTLYRGFMPRQDGLAAEDLAAILNFLATGLDDAKASAKFKPFTAAEVEKIRKASLTATAADVAKLRRAVPQASGK